jgi:hypothetical protein
MPDWNPLRPGSRTLWLREFVFAFNFISAIAYALLVDVDTHDLGYYLELAILISMFAAMMLVLLVLRLSPSAAYHSCKQSPKIPGVSPQGFDGNSGEYEYLRS